MNWRPKEGWKNPYSDLWRTAPYGDGGESQMRAFEAGADAMLEALKGFAMLRLQGETVITINDFRGQMSWVRTHGWLICIPDEENKT